LKGSKSIKKDWKKGNGDLAVGLEALFDLAWKDKYGVDGTTPVCGKLIQPFEWPNGLKSQLNPVDPFVLGLRVGPSSGDQTLFETKTIQVTSKSGRVVPAARLTAFFFVEKYTHINNTSGKGLKIDENSDTDSDPETPSPRKKRNRGRYSGSGSGEGDEDEEMNEVPP
jgi:hypothetical protein